MLYQLILKLWHRFSYHLTEWKLFPCCSNLSVLSAWPEVVNGVVKQNTVFNKYLLQKVICSRDICRCHGLGFYYKCSLCGLTLELRVFRLDLKWHSREIWIMHKSQKSGYFQHMFAGKKNLLLTANDFWVIWNVQSLKVDYPEQRRL